MLMDINYSCNQIEEQILFSIKVDDQIMFTKSLDGRRDQFIYQFDDSDEPCVMTVKMSLQGKTQEHTVIGPDGEIVSDCAVMIESIVLDGIDITELFCQGLPCYTHDTNGTTIRFLDEFYGYMGCNGDVDMQFELPLYRWFLEHCQ